MGHLSDGVLRRMIDEPLALDGRQREHYEDCSLCRARQAEIRLDAEGVAALLTRPEPQIDLAAAREHVRQSLAGVRVSRSPWRPMRMRVGAWTGLAAAVVALVLGTAFTPLGSAAQDLLTVFQPAQVAAVPITNGDLQTLRKLTRFGTVQAPQNLPSSTEPDAAAAAAVSGMAVPVPASLPSEVPNTVQYNVIPSTSASFTFSQAMAQQAIPNLPPMPAGMDGSTLQLTVGKSVLAIYGAGKGSMPSLVIGEMQAPVLRSTGLSISQMESYLLSLPGISPQLATEIRSLGDPATTLPIPVPVSMANAQDVTVQGVHGVAVGDSTGLGSVVVWEKDGIIYGVGGTLSEDTVLSIANSLH